MRNVLITSQEFAQDHWDETRQLFAQHGCNPIFNATGRAMTAEEICRMVNDHEAAAILVYSSSDEISRYVFTNCPSLKTISRHGVGVENIDLASAEEHGVSVKTTANCQDYEAVADLTFALMLALARRIAESDRNLRNNTWLRHKGWNIWQKTVGILGFGRIGQAVARRARGFDMKILVSDPYAAPEAIARNGAILCDKDRLLRESDIITLHCRLAEDTKDLIGAREFALMKKTAFLINTARAGLINQDSLIDALRSASIAGAAVDVYGKEPAINDPLLKMNFPNLVATPHIGSYTQEVLGQMDRTAVLNAVEVSTNRQTGKGAGDREKSGKFQHSGKA